MKVQDVMTSPAHSCTPETNLAAAAMTMRDYGCAALPVLDDAGRPVGILTDRDICLAVAEPNRFPAVIRVAEVMTSSPLTCSTLTDLGKVLDVMTAFRIRRLPVLDGEGRLVGIVSVSDILLAVQNIGSPLLRRIVAASRQIAEQRPWRRGPEPVPPPN